MAKEAHRQEMQRVGSTRRHKGPEVPFGIRAIESGIEVDGVWISRSNTPAQSLPATPAPASPASGPSIAPRPHPPKQEDSPDRSSSASNISRLDIPQPVYGYPTVNLRPSGPSSTTLNSSYERSKPGANSPISPGPDLPDLTRVQQIRPTYQPRHSSQLRYSNLYTYDNDTVATTAALEDGELSSDQKTPDGEFKLSYSRVWSSTRVACSTDINQNWMIQRRRKCRGLSQARPTTVLFLSATKWIRRQSFRSGMHPVITLTGERQSQMNPTFTTWGTNARSLSICQWFPE